MGARYRNTALLISQILNGVATGMLYALMGIGLSIITGVLNIPNFAHGALFALGAYLLYTVIQVVGNFWLALLLAPIGVGLLGALIEYAGVRPLYRAGHDYQLLLTFGLSLFFEGSAKVIWGADIVSLGKPALLGGALSVGRITFPTYWLFALVAAAVLAAAVWLLVERTSLGLSIRAATQDPMMAAVLGVNTQRLNTIVFALGYAGSGYILSYLFVRTGSYELLFAVGAAALLVGGLLGFASPGQARPRGK